MEITEKHQRACLCQLGKLNQDQTGSRAARQEWKFGNANGQNVTSISNGQMEKNGTYRRTRTRPSPLKVLKVENKPDQCPTRRQKRTIQTTQPLSLYAACNEQHKGESSCPVRLKRGEESLGTRVLGQAGLWLFWRVRHDAPPQGQPVLIVTIQHVNRPSADPQPT